MYIISSCWCLPDFTGTALVFFGIDKTRVTKVYNTALPTLRHRWSNIAQWCICAYIWNTSATSHGTSPVQTVARLKSLHHEMNFQIEVISAVDQSGEHLRRDHKRVLSAQCREVQVWTIWYSKYQYISMCTCTIYMIWCMNRVGYKFASFCAGKNSPVQMGRQVTSWVAVAMLGTSTHRAWLKSVVISAIRHQPWVTMGRVVAWHEPIRPWMWTATSARWSRATSWWRYQRLRRSV